MPCEPKMPLADDGGPQRREIPQKPMNFGNFVEVSQRMKDGLDISDEQRAQVLVMQKAISQSLEGLQSRITQVATQLQPFINKIPDYVRQFAEWQSRVALQFGPAISEFAVAFKNLPARLQSALILLAQTGWYIDPSMTLPAIWQIQESLESGAQDEVDSLLIEYFESQLEEIEESLVGALPKRELILRSAFRAHRRQEFELSVPVLLAQSDGVCLDLTGYHFFMKDRATKKPASSAYVSAIVGDEMSAAMLSVLSNVLPINATERERANFLDARGLTDWRELNRHTVLHGESLDYGTRINSLKAISLINYFVGVLSKRNLAETIA